MALCSIKLLTKAILKWNIEISRKKTFVQNPKNIKRVVIKVPKIPWSLKFVLHIRISNELWKSVFWKLFLVKFLKKLILKLKKWKIENNKIAFSTVHLLWPKRFHLTFPHITYLNKIKRWKVIHLGHINQWNSFFV